MSLSSFFGGAGANQSYRDDVRAATYRQKQIDLLEGEQALKDDQLALDQSRVIASQLGVLSRDGLSIDTKKLTERLAAQRESGQVDPSLQKLMTTVGNSDFSVKTNPGFQFKQFNVSPDGSFSMIGSYEGQEDNPRAATVNGGTDDSEDVIFASPEQVANAVGNGYNSLWQRKGNAGSYMQTLNKVQLGELSSDLDEAQQNTRAAVGQLRNQVDLFLGQYKGTPQEQAAQQAARKLTTALASADGIDAQLEVLQDFGEQLGVDGITEIANAVKGDAAASPATATPASASASASPATATPASDTATAPDTTAQVTDADIDAYKKANPLEANLPDRVIASRLRGQQREEMSLAERAGARNNAGAEDNSARIAEIEQILARPLPKNARSGVVKRRQALQKELEGLQGKPPAPAATESAPGNDEAVAPAVAELGEQVKVAQAAGDTNAVKVIPTREQVAALKQSLEAKGIRSFEDIERASLKEQRALLAVLSTDQNVDPAQRERYMIALNNMIETGTLSYDRKSLDAAVLDERKQGATEYSYETARQNIIRLRDEFVSGEVGTNSAFINKQGENVSKLFIDGDGNALDPSVEQYQTAALGQNGSITNLFRRLQGAMNRQKSGAGGRDVAGAESRQLTDALLAQISFGMQFVSQDGDLEWSLATDSDAPLTANDSRLARITRDGKKDAQGRSGIIILKPGTNTQDGDAFSAKQVQEFFGGNDELSRFFFTKLDEIEQQRAGN
jgi:hypothetical protein